MTLFLNRIEKKEWLTLLRKIGIEQKWFISIFHQCKNEFYSVDFLSRSEERIQIGTCTFSKINTETDCSIFIFPEHRRKGFATQLILDLTARYENIQFTVSTYNTISLRLFDVIPLLKNSESNSKNKTCTFIKKNNYLMHKMNNQLNNFNNEKKWFKKLLKETTLLENSNISSKDLYLLELYLKGFSDVKMIIETKLTKNKIEVILLKSLVKITKRINELENKENYLNELITNIKETDRIINKSTIKTAMNILQPKYLEPSERNAEKYG